MREREGEARARLGMDRGSDSTRAASRMPGKSNRSLLVRLEPRDELPEGEFDDGGCGCDCGGGGRASNADSGFHV